MWAFLYSGNMGIESPHNEGLFTDPEKLSMAEALLNFVPRQGIERGGESPEDVIGAPEYMHTMVERLQQDLDWCSGDGGSNGVKRQEFPDGSVIEANILLADRGIELDNGRATVYIRVLALKPDSEWESYRDISYALDEDDTHVGRTEVQEEISFLQNFDLVYERHGSISLAFEHEMKRETAMLLDDLDPSTDYAIEHMRMNDDFFRQLSDQKRRIHVATLQSNMPPEVPVGTKELQELARKVFLLD
jgi:hypothetical protein